MLINQKKLFLGALIINVILNLSIKLNYYNRIIDVVIFFVVSVIFINLSLKKSYSYGIFILLMGLSIQSDLFRYLLSLENLFILFVKYFNQKPIVIKQNKVLTKLFFLLVFYLFILYIIFQRIYSDFWSFPLYFVTFLSYVFACFIFLNLKFTNFDLEIIRKSVFTFVIIHTLTVFITPLIIQRYSLYFSILTSLHDFLSSFGLSFVRFGGFSGDGNTSTLSSSNTIGLLSFPFFIFLLLIYFIKKEKPFLLLSIITLFVFLITDTKHSLLGCVFGLFIVLILFLKKNNNALQKYFFAIIMIIVSIFIIINFDKLLNSIDFFKNEFYYRRDNPKYELYRRCLNENIQNPLFAIIGRGPGTFGSRVSNARAADILYKSEIKLPNFIPLTTNQDYKNVMAGLYEQSFAKRSKSGAMQNPFSSFIGIVMEMGLIGSALFITILLIIIRYCIISFLTEKDVYWSAFFLSTISFVVLILYVSLFDQYFETPALMMPFWIMISVALKRDYFNKHEFYSDKYRKTDY